MTSHLQPSFFAGYGREYGGIDGVEFAARCPPDVQRNSRIVAVCGTPMEQASPQEDGWFFSDFFLFFQMIGSRTDIPEQLWLTCCSPKELVREHKQYLHGPASETEGERRVVMNAAMLPKDEFAAGFRVFEKKDLLEKFLATLKAEIQQAAKNNQPVLVLIFGHGETDTSDIFFASSAAGKPYWKLTEKMLASVLLKEV